MCFSTSFQGTSRLKCLLLAIGQLEWIHHPELVNLTGVVLHHNNAKPCTSSITCQKLLEFGWDVLPHTPHLHDLAPSGFHFFCTLENSLRGLAFNSYKAVFSTMFSFLPIKAGVLIWTRNYEAYWKMAKVYKTKQAIYKTGLIFVLYINKWPLKNKIIHHDFFDNLISFIPMQFV